MRVTRNGVALGCTSGADSGCTRVGVGVGSVGVSWGWDTAVEPGMEAVDGVIPSGFCGVVCVIAERARRRERRKERTKERGERSVFVGCVMRNVT